MELVALQIDIARQDVIQNHIFDEIASVIFFIIILLDVVHGHSQNFYIAPGVRVSAGNKGSIARPLAAAKGLKSVFIVDKDIVTGHILCDPIIEHISHTAQIAAGNDNRRLISHTDGTVDGVAHLVDNSLEQSVGHKLLPLPLKYW